MTRESAEVSVPPTLSRPEPTNGPPVSTLKRVGSVLLSYILVLSLFGYYSFGAALTEVAPRSAGYHNSARVWEIQHFLHLPSEAWLQQVFLSDPWVYPVLNRYYTFVHFPVTLLFVIWVCVARRDSWKRIAPSLSVMTFLCLTIVVIFPVAPPRLYSPLGIIDSLAKFGPDIYGNEAVHSVADQYGAMPSIHFGWSVFVAWGIISLTPSLKAFRWLALLHPAMTLAAVVLTGNHYWLDCIVAAILVPIGIWATDTWMRRSSPALRARMRKPLLIAAIPLCLFGLLNISSLFV